jgi:hypothetical protein
MDSTDPYLLKAITLNTNLAPTFVPDGKVVHSNCLKDGSFLAVGLTTYQLEPVPSASLNTA